MVRSAALRRSALSLDNLTAHKVPGVREAIEAKGAKLRYLPQYSPDLNPIEMPFSIIASRAVLRRAVEPLVHLLADLEAWQGFLLDRGVRATVIGRNNVIKAE
jgi:transposase